MVDKVSAKILAGTFSQGVSVPPYARNSVKSSIVHIGAGGFHRSHQQHYMDRLLTETEDLSWGICASGIRKEDRALKQALSAQDYLYTSINDPIADTLIQKAREGGDDAQALLSLREVFGDLANNDGFKKEVSTF